MKLAHMRLLFVRLENETINHYLFMKKLYNISQHLIIIFCIILLSACAASKSAYSPTGTWDYEVTNTPDGDSNGKMILSKNGDEYTGNFQTSEYGTIAMRNVMVEDNALKSTFYIEGETFELNGLFEGDSFTGKITSNYGTFGVSAHRIQ
jgi:hypothetical protein